MVKKLIKKKPPTSTSAASKKPEDDSIEMPMARQDDADDVAEDHKIFDMSNIAAPVIEFEMPNLEERKVEKSPGKSAVKIEPKSAKKGRGRPPKKTTKAVKKDSGASEDVKEDSEDSEVDDDEEKDSEPKKTVKKAKKSAAPESDDVTQLTAEKLNDELVSLRPWILKARNQLTMKIVRQKKGLKEKQKNGKGGKAEEEVERQLKRMGEEILGLKTIDRDTIAKFAALNTKNLDQLKINGSTPLSERLMYKLACHNVVVARIKAIRKKYIEWNKTAAFFMQRLGQQYSNKAEKKKKTPTTPSESQKKDSEDSNIEEDSEESEDDHQEESGDEEDSEGSEDAPEEYDQSDVEMVDSDEEDVSKEAAAKRRNLLLGLIGVKEDKTRPALKPKKRKLVEDDSDDVPTSSGAAASGAKKQKTKETVKEEMKKVLEKELKTKETKNPKQAKKTKKTPSPQKKKKPLRTPTKTSLIDENMELSESEDVVEDLSQKTLVMKINLSEGGKIAKTPKSAPKPKKTEKTPVAPKKADSDDDDEGAGFFLPANTTTKPKILKMSTKKKPEVPSYTRPLTPSKSSGCKHRKQEKKAFQPEPSTFSTDKKKGSSKNNTPSEGELHPSWVASQLKKKELAAAKPAGKRILFSDDDD